MTRPIPDKAEVALEYPDKLYIGTFERSARFEANFDETGIALVLSRNGDADTRKSVHVHLHYALFAEIISELADAALHGTPAGMPRERLRDAALLLARSLDHEPNPKQGDKPPGVGELTPEQEVLLLHVME